MNGTDEDVVVVHDRAARRRFIRRGAAFVLAGGAIAASRTGLPDECDRGEGCETPANCSDGDAGEHADPTGRGKRCSTISISDATVKVEKIRG